MSETQTKTTTRYDLACELADGIYNEIRVRAEVDERFDGGIVDAAITRLAARVALESQTIDALGGEDDASEPVPPDPDDDDDDSSEPAKLAPAKSSSSVTEKPADDRAVKLAWTESENGRWEGVGEVQAGKPSIRYYVRCERDSSLHPNGHAFPSSPWSLASIRDGCAGRFSVPLCFEGAVFAGDGRLDGANEAKMFCFELACAKKWLPRLWQRLCTLEPSSFVQRLRSQPAPALPWVEFPLVDGGTCWQAIEGPDQLARPAGVWRVTKSKAGLTNIDRTSAHLLPPMFRAQSFAGYDGPHKARELLEGLAWIRHSCPPLWRALYDAKAPANP